MPFVVSQSNYEKVARSHLTPGERMVEVVGAGRGVVAVTDQRLLVSDFPWVGKGRLLFDVPLDGLADIHVEKTGYSAQVVIRTAAGHTRRASITAMFVGPVEALTARLRERIAGDGGTLRAPPVPDAAELALTLPCGQCGASLIIPPQGDTIVCRYCGAGTPIPPVARQAQAIDGRLAAMLNQARAELANALYVRGASALAHEPIGAFLGMGLGAAVGVLLANLVHPGVGICAGLTLAVVFALPIIIVFHMVDEALARWRAERMAARLAAKAREATCPACGAPLEVPGGTASFTCGHCGGALVAAEGLVARWTGDAEAVVAAWRTAVASLADVQAERMTRAAPFVVAAFFTLLLVSLCCVGFNV